MESKTNANSITSSLTHFPAKNLLTLKIISFSMLIRSEAEANKSPFEAKIKVSNFGQLTVDDKKWREKTLNKFLS